MAAAVVKSKAVLKIPVAPPDSHKFRALVVRTTDTFASVVILSAMDGEHNSGTCTLIEGRGGAPTYRVHPTQKHADKAKQKKGVRILRDDVKFDIPVGACVDVGAPYNKTFNWTPGQLVTIALRVEYSPPKGEYPESFWFKATHMNPGATDKEHAPFVAAAVIARVHNLGAPQLAPRSARLLDPYRVDGVAREHSQAAALQVNGSHDGACGADIHPDWLMKAEKDRNCTIFKTDDTEQRVWLDGVNIRHASRRDDPMRPRVTTLMVRVWGGHLPCVDPERWFLVARTLLTTWTMRMFVTAQIKNATNPGECSCTATGIFFEPRGVPVSRNHALALAGKLQSVERKVPQEWPSDIKADSTRQTYADYLLVLNKKNATVPEEEDNDYEYKVCFLSPRYMRVRAAERNRFPFVDQAACEALDAAYNIDNTDDGDAWATQKRVLEEPKRTVLVIAVRRDPDPNLTGDITNTVHELLESPPDPTACALAESGGPAAPATGGRSRNGRSRADADEDARVNGDANGEAVAVADAAEEDAAAEAETQIDLPVDGEAAAATVVDDQESVGNKRSASMSPVADEREHQARRKRRRT